jgi:hypothetical protein
MTGDGDDAGASGEQPDALALLVVARETLLQDVLPVLDDEQRYRGLMIASAMAIAIRELTPGAHDPGAELEALRGLYEHDEAPGGESTEDALARLEARLARDLRRGALDGGEQFAVRRWLRRRIESRLGVSNPRLLARRKGAGTAPGGS